MGSWELIHFLFIGKVKTDECIKNMNNAELKLSNNGSSQFFISLEVVLVVQPYC